MEVYLIKIFVVNNFIFFDENVTELIIFDSKVVSVKAQPCHTSNTSALYYELSLFHHKIVFDSFTYLLFTSVNYIIVEVQHS